jgi:integrase/recombinase XerD
MTTRQAIELFIRHKESIGHVFATDARVLRRFYGIVGPRTPLGKITTRTISAYLDENKAGTATYWARQYFGLKGFYGFAVQQSLATHSPLPLCRIHHSTFTPYIFSRTEIQRLLAGTGTYQATVWRLQPDTLRIMLLLLYGTGLRISEAVGLTKEDVDLKQGVLTIRLTKFYKTRLVCIGSDLCRALHRYRATRTAGRQGKEECSAFFTCKNGAAVTDHIIRNAFARVCKHVALRRDDVKQQPRLHDLRHTFAVHRLISWYERGLDVQRLLPLLATHLGHISIETTKHYLTMTPELLEQANVRFERYANGEESHA